MNSYEEQKEALEYAVTMAHRAHDANANKLTAKLLSKTYHALAYFKEYHATTADIMYMANHIEELNESDFVTPYEYSLDVDSSIIELCEEFGV